MKKYVIHGILRTLSPLHIAAPGNMYVDLATGYAVRSTAGCADPMPCTATQTLDIPVEGSIGLTKVPVIPGNNVMGHLRRHAAAIVLDALFAKGERVNLQTYTALQCGAVTGKPDGADPTFAHYRETRANVYLGLFGGGPRMMRRRVHTINAVPVTEDTLFMFARDAHPNYLEATHRVRRPVVAGDQPEKDAKVSKPVFTQAWTFRRNDDLRDLVNMDLASHSIENFEDEMRVRQSVIADDTARKKQNMKDAADGKAVEEKAGRNTTFTFSALEFVLPGTRFPTSFTLNVSPAQLGLFLLALDRFCETDTLGGHSRNGFGKFELNDVMLSVDGKLTTGFWSNNRLVRDHKDVESYLAAWEKEAAALTAADLDRLLAPPVEKEKEKKSKAA